jgi:cyclopropane-fatty-acyl-phospholipid synthase
MMWKNLDHVINLLQRRHASLCSSSTLGAFTLQSPNGDSYVFGHGDPTFSVVAKNNQGLLALSTCDATTILEAYMSGALDFNGDLLRAFALRDMFTDRHILSRLWCFVQPLIFGQVSSDKNWISKHYDYESDFYTLFLDRKHRCYSQGIFLDDCESLESAMTRKLDFAIEATGVKPGDHILDIGTGWGAFVEHAGLKDIRVTSLTISRESEVFVNDLIAKNRLPCLVVRQHLLEFNPDERYDAIVNSGVTEHLPDYRATLAKYQALLKPGGRVYLDASASWTKQKVHSFIYKHIFPGNGYYMCLPEYLAQVAHTPFRLNAVYNDRHSYYLTTKHWAINLDRHREEIVRRWGEAHYRKFQLYLWGSVDGFLRDILQAYRVVLEMP